MCIGYRIFYNALNSNIMLWVVKLVMSVFWTEAEAEAELKHAFALCNFHVTLRIVLKSVVIFFTIWILINTSLALHKLNFEYSPKCIKCYTDLYEIKLKPSPLHTTKKCVRSIIQRLRVWILTSPGQESTRAKLAVLWITASLANHGHMYVCERGWIALSLKFVTPPLDFAWAVIWKDAISWLRVLPLRKPSPSLVGSCCLIEEERVGGQ